MGGRVAGREDWEIQSEIGRQNVLRKLLPVELRSSGLVLEGVD